MTWEQVGFSTGDAPLTGLNTGLLSSADSYSMLDQRGRRNTLEDTLAPVDGDGGEVNVPNSPCVADPSAADGAGCFFPLVLERTSASWMLITAPQGAKRRKNTFGSSCGTGTSSGLMEERNVFPFKTVSV